MVTTGFKFDICVLVLDSWENQYLFQWHKIDIWGGQSLQVRRYM